MSPQTPVRKIARPVIWLMCLAVAGTSLSACGRKDGPKLPEGQPDTFNKTYPNPNL